MPLWFYALTPFGWFSLYLTLIVFVHESGHLAIGLLTGHKITKFKVGLCKPIARFQIGNILFEFSLDAMGGSVSCDNTKHVSQIGIFLTAMAGPFAVFLLATGVFLLIPEFSKENFEQKTWQYFYQMILLALSCMTYWIGLEDVVRDFRNILVPRS